MDATAIIQRQRLRPAAGSRGVRRPGGHPRSGPRAAAPLQPAGGADSIRSRHGHGRLRDPLPRRRRALPLRAVPHQPARPLRATAVQALRHHLEPRRRVVRAHGPPREAGDPGLRGARRRGDGAQPRLLDHPQDALRAVQGSAQFSKLVLDTEQSVHGLPQPPAGRERRSGAAASAPGPPGGPARWSSSPARSWRSPSRSPRRAPWMPWPRTAAAWMCAWTAPAGRPLPRPPRGRTPWRCATPAPPPWSQPWRWSPSGCRPPPPCRPSQTPCWRGCPSTRCCQADAPQFFDLERRGSRTFLVKVDTPGLYRLETSGLLETSGTLRSRVITSLDTQDVQRRGPELPDPAVPARGRLPAHGARRGPLGGAPRGPPRPHARCARAVGCCPAFPPGSPWARARACSTPSGSPSGPTTPCAASACASARRAGWRTPRGGRSCAPGGNAEFSRAFDAGDYRLVLLPGPVPSRRLTVLEPVAPPSPLRRARSPPPAPRPGGGAPLAGARGRCPAASRHLGIRAAGDGDHSGDALRGDGRASWCAPATARCSTGARPGKVLLKGLPAGRYELRVTSATAQQPGAVHGQGPPPRAPPGQTQAVRTPNAREDLGGCRGHGGAVLVRRDRRARRAARRSRSRVVASSDDRPDDWNFLISTQLAPGRYSLHVRPVGSDSATCTVRMTTRSEVEEAEWSPPGQPGDHDRRHRPSGAARGCRRAPSCWSSRCAAARRSGSGWSRSRAEPGSPSPARWVGRSGWACRSPGTPGCACACGPRTSGGCPVTVRAAAVVPAHVDESKLSGGASLVAVAGGDPTVGCARRDRAPAGRVAPRGRGRAAVERLRPDAPPAPASGVWPW